jgi:hypothetical protein
LHRARETVPAETLSEGSGAPLAHAAARTATPQRYYNYDQYLQP